MDDSLFTVNKTFSYKLTAAIEQDRIYKDAVEKLWLKLDKDKNGILDKQEARTFLQEVMANIPPPNDFNEAKFEETFAAIDKNNNGKLEKNEMVMFVKSIAKQRDQAQAMN